MKAMGSHHSPRALSCVWLTPPEIIAIEGQFIDLRARVA